MPKIKYYDSVTGQWVPANPIGQVSIDTTLTESGNAADAKVTGDKIELKLDATKLPEAVNDALAQAKESGEFDGAPGDPGVVISDTEPVDKDKFPVWINPNGEGIDPDISLGLTGMRIGDTVEVASIGPGGVPTGWRKPGEWELIEEYTADGGEVFYRVREPDGTLYNFQKVCIKTEIQAGVVDTVAFDVYQTYDTSESVSGYRLAATDSQRYTSQTVYLQNGYYFDECFSASGLWERPNIVAQNYYNRFYRPNKVITPLRRISAREPLQAGLKILIYGVRA